MRHTVFTLFLAIFAFTGPVCRVAAGEAAGKGFPLRAASASPYGAAPFSAPRVTASPGASTASASNAVAPAASAVPAISATTAAPAVQTAQDYASQPITFSSGERRRARSDDEQGGFRMPSIWPAIFTVAIVCGLFCVMLCLVKKYLPGHKQLFSHPAMEILGRTHLDQRRYVSLLRVGKRIVVIGVSPDEMRSLSEITDEEEITGILEIARPKTEAGVTVFQRLFQRTVARADAEETRALAVEKARQLDEQMSSLRQRVAEIREGEAEAPAPAPAPARGKTRARLDAMG